jgi:hypothetical protein
MDFYFVSSPAYSDPTGNMPGIPYNGPVLNGLEA